MVDSFCLSNTIPIFALFTGTYELVHKAEIVVSGMQIEKGVHN